MTGCSIFSNFDQTTGFYWSYTLLLKPPVLIHSCTYRRTRKFFRSKIFVDVPLQCISEIILEKIFAGVGHMAGAHAYVQCGNGYFTNNISQYESNCEYSKNFMSTKISHPMVHVHSI